MSETITLTTKQANKVEELARNAAELAGQAFEDDKTRYAAVLRLTNRKRQNGGKFTLTCVPGFAKAAIDAAMASGKAPKATATPKATTPKATASGKFVPYDDGKGMAWQARSANRAKRNGGIDPLAPKATATAKPKLADVTVASLATRVDTLEDKLDRIIGMLTK